MTSLADDPLNDDVTDILLNSMENNGLEPKNEVYYDDFSISAVSMKKTKTALSPISTAMAACRASEPTARYTPLYS